MYRFLQLNDEEKLQRRQQLDHYGWVAHISTLAPVFVLQCILLVIWTFDTGHQASSSRKPLNHGLLRRLMKRVSWWCDEQVDCLGFYRSSRGVIVLSLLWTGWMIYLSFLGTGEDYVHLTAQFGLVGVSQIPLVYLLSLKTALSPLGGLACNFLGTLRPMHKYMGSVIAIFFMIHSGLYLNMYIQTGTLREHLLRTNVALGLVGAVSFFILGICATPLVRNWSYRFFYATHVMLAIITIPVLFFHGKFMRIYLLEAFAIYLGNAFLRSRNTVRIPATITPIQCGDSLIVSISLRSTHPFLNRWHPGQYILLSRWRNPLASIICGTPLSIATLPNAEGEFRVAARVRQGATLQLSKPVKSLTMLTMEGPYGNSRTPLHAFSGCADILLIAGGIGATFVLPFYRELLSQRSNDEEEGPRLAFHWVVRSIADTSWAMLDHDARELPGFVENLHLHVTRASLDESTSLDSQTLLRDRDNGSISRDLEKQLQHDDVPHFQTGRPNLADLVSDLFAHGSTYSAPVGIIACGPPSLVKEVRRKASFWVGRGGECVWLAETFGE